jgi:preprotein translocase subunit SecB
MENNKSKDLRFRGYEVIKMNVNKVYDIDHSVKENIGFMFKIIPKDKTEFQKVNIIQGVKINATENYPFEIEVVLKGNFEIGDNLEYKDKLQLLLTNASAILFPYLRATVSLISSQLDYEKILLPVINFTKIFRKADLEKLILEPSQFEDF